MIQIDIEKQLFSKDGIKILDIDLQISKGEFVALTGESGNGKSTLLRILAGLEDAKGTIKVDGDIWLDDNICIKPQYRDIGFVFQDYALFDNMTVLQNLLFASDDIEFATKLLEMTELIGLKNRYPNMLSGGQKQRISLCRAMMRKPKILLLDEPLSALHNDIRVKLQKQILQFHKEFNITTILVSHDYDEIKNLSSRILTLKDGKLYENKKHKTISTIDAKILDIKDDIITIKTSQLLDTDLKDITITF